MIEVGVVKVLDRHEQLEKAMKYMLSRHVLVGVPAGQSFREPDVDEKEAPANNAEIAFWQDQGTPTIPQREFMRPGAESVMPAIRKEMTATAHGVLTAENPNIGMVDVGLHRVGLTAESGIKRKITNGPFLPLAEYTIFRRLERGRTGTKPLMDTGQLRRAITYVVEGR